MTERREAPSVAEQVASVPDAPGVYLWKDAAGEVLYVGKAKSLRKRMRQYTSGHDDREKIPLMMELVKSFDYVVTGTEVESLILEANLIKQFHPPYNVDYRDDKSFPFIALTMCDPFPSIKYTREKHKPGVRYFGPYTDARAARENIDIVRRIVPICRATCPEWKRVTAKGGEPAGRACFDYHVGLGPGPCVGACTPEQYAENVDRVAGFLSGKHGQIERELESQMHAAAADLDYEAAAKYRNRLEAVAAIRQRQTIVSARKLDADIVGFFREETIAGVHLFVVREGRVLVGNELILDKGSLDVPAAELISGFLLRYYADASDVGKEIVLPDLPDEPEAMADWLSVKRGNRVTLTIPQKGEKRNLLSLAERNAQHTLMRFKVRTRYDEERLNTALLQIESALALPAPPLRIECYDISTLHGRHSVGSMVVFTNGRPDSKNYRRFRIRCDTGEANDVAMMSEVLRRRFAPERMADGRFGSRPGLVIVDGGKPQLNAARAVFAELGLDIPVVGLAKRDEEVWVPWAEQPVILPTGSASLYLVKRVRDEAHRFAIEYHRKLRGKAMTASVLDEIAGVGAKRKKAIMRHFGSVKRLREATAEEIAQVPGVPHLVAEEIVAVVAQWAESSESQRA